MYPTFEDEQRVFGSKISYKIDEDGIIYINGKPLEDIDNLEKMEDPGLAINEITLGEDEYFVLGDNRNNSVDSRNPLIGNIKREHILSKAVEIGLFKD